jgi:hypothetical protein
VFDDCWVLKVRLALVLSLQLNCFSVPFLGLGFSLKLNLIIRIFFIRDKIGFGFVLGYQFVVVPNLVLGVFFFFFLISNLNGSRLMVWYN